MKVLLLGATGLLGHNVLLRLVDEGHQVRALVRCAEGLKLKDLCEVREGSPLDYEVLREAAVGCDAVINCAGTTDMSLRRYEDYLPVNRDLCRLLVRLVEEEGIGTLVHTSTVNTIGYGIVHKYAHERIPMWEPFLSSYYASSKREGEDIILEAAKRLDDRHIIVINPGYLLGPWDVKPSSGRMLLAGYRKPVMIAPWGGKAFVHVQDVAQAVVSALTRGTHGRRYIAANRRGCITIRDLYKLQAKIYGYGQWVIVPPDWLVRAAGWVGDVLRAVGLKTELSTSNVKQLLVHEFYDGSLAADELGMPATPIEEAIKDFHQWRKENT